MREIPRDFVAFDIETTGFAPPCRIIEIGAVKVIDGRIEGHFQTLINPCCPIPRNITDITGIDNIMVADAPFINDVLPCFLEFAGNFPLAAHNAQFDMRFIHYEANKAGYVVKNRIIDTLALVRRYYPYLSNHKLATVTRHMGIVNKTEHRGLGDALAVAGILLKLSLPDDRVHKCY